MMALRRYALLFGISLASATLIADGTCAAQDYPSGLIRMFVAAGVGTPPDIISRIVAAEIQKNESWKVIVENKVGAMQTLAGAEVLKQPADGRALVSVSLPGMTEPAL